MKDSLQGTGHKETMHMYVLYAVCPFIMRLALQPLKACFTAL